MCEIEIILPFIEHEDLTMFIYMSWSYIKLGLMA